MAVIDDVKSVIASTLKVPVAQLQDVATLGDAGAASIDIIEIIYGLEEKFDIDISEGAKSGKLAAAGAQATAQAGTQAGADLLNQVVDMTIADLARAVESLVKAKTS